MTALAALTDQRGARWAFALQMGLLWCVLGASALRHAPVAHTDAPASSHGGGALRHEGVLPLRHLAEEEDKGAAASQALYSAAESGDDDAVVAAIDSGADLNFTAGPFGDTPLTIAAAKGHTGPVSILIAAGASPDQTDAFYRATAVYWASQNGHEGAVSELIRAGADVNLGDRAGERPLIVASEEKHLPVVKLLLESGALVNVADDAGTTALHAATVSIGEEGRAILRALLGAGATVDAASADGQTPLMWAAEFGNAGAMRTLLGEGADGAAEDNRGNSVEDLICSCIRSAGRPHLLQCPHGGCDDRRAWKTMQRLLSDG